MSQERRIELFRNWAELDEKKEALYGYKVIQMLHNLRRHTLCCNQKLSRIILSNCWLRKKWNILEQISTEKESFVFYRTFQIAS